MARAIVVGAGPAGLSAALGLLRSGKDVTVFEQRPRWQGRVCGGFLNAEAVRHLDWLGVLEDVRSEAVSIHHTEITFGNSTQPLTLPHHGELGLPRQRLEEILMERVRGEGGEIRLGERVSPGDIPIILAGGRGVGNKGNWYGWNANFSNVRQNPGEMSLHFYAGGYIGTLTYADGQTNICGLVKKKSGETLVWDKVYAQALEKNHGFREKMRQAERVTEWRGVGPLPFGNHLNEEWRVGDAAAVGEPFMGEGIGRALSAGPMVYDALKSGVALTDLWNTAYRGRFRLSRVLRTLLLEQPIFFFLFGKSLGQSLSNGLWRKINEYGYHPQNVSHPKFREVLPV